MEENPTSSWDVRMLSLAIFTFAYSLMVAFSTICETLAAYKILFKGFSILMVMDVIVNFILPLVLAYHGFFLILYEKNFLSAVLNTTALLFIPEIDDQLPNILGYREDDIIRNFLIAESMKDFDVFSKMQTADDFTTEKLSRNYLCGVQFGDFYITNLKEQGFNILHGHTFQPHQVNNSEENKGYQIDPSTTITPDCLLRKVQWKYTTGFPNTTKPRVGCLTLKKINGQDISIIRKQDPSGKVGIDSKINELEGLFVITTFQMSEDVIKLRLCGSYNPQHFLKAFEYYSLWDVTDEARQMILRL